MNKDKKKRCRNLERWKKDLAAWQRARQLRILAKKKEDAVPPIPSDENEKYEKTMTGAEKAEREVYIKDMWKMHQEACVNSGFMTQTPPQFRENMRGFWRLNHDSRPWTAKEK
jgi:hypothetical protein